MEEYAAKCYYLGRNERQAGYQLYKAIRDAKDNPLMFQVSLSKDNETVVKVPLD